jgi:hypothetical protein
VWARKVGGVSLVTCFSLERFSISAGSGFSPRRFFKEPPWLMAGSRDVTA